MDIANLGFSVDSRELVTAENRLDRVDSAGKRVERGSKSITRAFAGVGRVFAGLGVGLLAADTFRAAASLETLEASLKTVTGSASAADQALSGLREFAKTTPFDLDQSVQGFIKLKALGLDPSIDSLQSYANTASALGKSLNQAVEAVADAATGEFERLKEFGIRARKQGEEVTFTFQGISTTVGNSAAEIEGYLQDIGNVNFAGAALEQSEALSGVFSNLRQSFTDLQTSFFETSGLGDGLKDVFNDVASGLNSVASSLSGDTPKLLQDLGSLFSFLFEVTKGVANATVLAITGISNLYDLVRPALSQFSSLFDDLFQSSNDVVGVIDVLKGVLTESQLVGIALVDGLLTGFEEIKGGVRILGEALKAAFFGAFDLILESYAKLLTGVAEGLSRLPFIDNQAASVRAFAIEVSNVITPLDDFAEAKARIKRETEAAQAAISEITSDLADNAIAAKSASTEVEKVSKSTKLFSDNSKSASLNVKATKDELKSLTDTMNELNEVTELAGKRFDGFRTASELIANEVRSNNREQSKSAIVVAELASQYKKGIISLKEYEAATKSLGLETKDTTSAMNSAWENFSKGAFDSVKSFARSTLDSFSNIGDGFKDLGKNLISLAKDIVADLIATFASNALKNVFSNLFGGGGQGGGGGFDISSIFGGGSGQSGTGGIGGIIKTLFGGGNTSSAGPVAPTSGIFSKIGSLFSPSGGIGKLFADGGFFGSGGGLSSFAAVAGPIAAAIASIAIGRKLTEDITGNTGKLLGNLGLAGGLFAKGLESLGLIGNARTKQELAEDQLSAVNQAISEGRTERVDLGQVNGVSVGFRGGFDENSTFFDIGGSPEIQKRVADLLVANFGFDQARVVEDGVLRLEDFSREFSSNNDRIVSEVKASIAEVSLSLEATEKQSLKSLGGTLVEFDRLFDATEGSAKSVSERVIDSFSTAFNVTTDEAKSAVDELGISADRIAELFGSASGEVIEALFGVSQAGSDVAGSLANDFRLAANDAVLSFSDIESSIDRASVAASRLSDQSAKARAAAQVSQSTSQSSQRSRQQASPQSESNVEQLKRVADSLELVIPFVRNQAAQGV